MKRKTSTKAPKTVRAAQSGQKAATGRDRRNYEYDHHYGLSLQGKASTKRRRGT